jgi:DNA polymerase-3 subunit delta
VLWDAVEDWKSAWKSSTNGASRPETFTAPNIDFNQLLGAGATMPMFETIQPIVIKDVEKLNSKKLEEFLRIHKQSPSSTKWLLTSEGMDKRKAEYKSLSSLGPVELFPKIYPEKLGGWVQRIATSLEATLSSAAVEMVASVHGHDLFGARQTIERAVLYTGRKRRIEVADVELVMAGEGEYDVFQLLEAASRNDFSRALSIARSLLASSRSDSEISFWLALIHGQCVRFLQLLEHAGKTNEQVGQILHIHPFLVGKLRTQAAGFGHDGLTGTVAAAFETDWAIKTSTLTPQLAWELFVWRVAHARTNVSNPLSDLESPRVRD